MQTVHSLVSGAAQVKEELGTLQSLGSLPSGDAFVEVMQVSFRTSSHRSLLLR